MDLPAVPYEGYPEEEGIVGGSTVKGKRTLFLELGTNTFHFVSRCEFPAYFQTPSSCSSSRCFFIERGSFFTMKGVGLVLFW